MPTKVTYADNGMGGMSFPTNPALVRSGIASPGEYGEATPVLFRGSHLLVASAQKGARANPTGGLCLWIEDTRSRDVIATFAPGYSLASAIVADDALHVYAIPSDSGGAGHIDHFVSRDLMTWESSRALEALDGEELFQRERVLAGDRYVMAFESRDAHYPPFTIYFAESTDLRSWRRIPGAVFGTDRYTACPAIRFVDGAYYMLYLEHRKPRWWFETFLARSRDLVDWELAPGESGSLASWRRGDQHERSGPHRARGKAGAPVLPHRQPEGTLHRDLGGVRGHDARVSSRTTLEGSEACTSWRGEP